MPTLTAEIKDGKICPDTTLGLCDKFLSAADPQTGLKRIKGTSDLNTAEFEEFLDRSRQLGAELGVFIPLPGEYERMIS